MVAVLHCLAGSGANVIGAMSTRTAGVNLKSLRSRREEILRLAPA
jgi:hypothetical protein